MKKKIKMKFNKKSFQYNLKYLSNYKLKGSLSISLSNLSNYGSDKVRDLGYLFRSKLAHMHDMTDYDNRIAYELFDINLNDNLTSISGDDITPKLNEFSSFI